MMDYSGLYRQLEIMKLAEWGADLSRLIAKRMSETAHGKIPIWQNALTRLPELVQQNYSLSPSIVIGNSKSLSEQQKQLCRELLQHFHPWRKGPYSLLGIDIDTEWRSDWKWQRVLPHIENLSGRVVLDIGSGNGYHGWRMLGEGAEFVLSVDPTRVFTMQYWVLQKYIQSKQHYVVPIGIEDLPQNLACFDTVFSMGVLYHRRSPIDHLLELRACLRSGGELVIETLVVDKKSQVLIPENRYAKMRNVWFIPSIDIMCTWLKRTGFKKIQCVDITMTTIDEQRATDWMHFESLKDFLDPKDSRLTIEGYPAPTRAIFIANAP